MGQHWPGRQRLTTRPKRAKRPRNRKRLCSMTPRKYVAFLRPACRQWQGHEYPEGCLEFGNTYSKGEFSDGFDTKYSRCRERVGVEKSGCESICAKTKETPACHNCCSIVQIVPACSYLHPRHGSQLLLQNGVHVVRVYVDLVYV